MGFKSSVALAAMLGAAVSTVSASNVFDMTLEELMNQTVTSVSKQEEEKRTAAAAIYVVTSEDMRRTGVSSIPEALRLVPGVQVARIDANKWSISARGNNRQYTNKLLVLMDGRTIYTPLFSGVFWDAQDYLIEDIDRIEVIRGPGGSLWGANAVNGVINIVTKSAKETQGGYVQATAGNEIWGAEARYGGKIGENTTYRLYGKHIDHEEQQFPNNVNSKDDYDVSRGGFRIDHETNATNYTAIGNFYSGKATDDSFVPSLTPGVPIILTDPTDFDGANINLSFNTQRDNSSLHGKLYYDYINRDINIVQKQRHTIDAELQYNFTPIANHEVSIGAGYRFMSDDINGTNYLLYTDENLDFSVSNIFIQDKISLLEDTLYLTLGSKFEYNDFTHLEIQPNARIAYTPTKDTTLWGAVSYAVRTPTRHEESLKSISLTVAPSTIFTQSGSPHFESEELTAYELGLRTKLCENLSLDISAYYNDYDNLRTFEQETPFINTTHPTLSPFLDLPLVVDNLGYGETYGAELSATWQINPKWRMEANYTYTKVHLHLDDLSTDVGTLEPDEERTSEHLLSLRSHANLPYGIELDNMLYYADELRNVDDYIRFDTRVSYQVNENVGIEVIGKNLFDSEHVEFNDSFYAESAEIERSIFGRVTVEF